MVKIPEPTLLLAPGRSRDRSGPVSPSLTGGVIEVAGQYGRAWQVAEATTNYVYNPRAKNDLSNVATSTAHTYERDTSVYMGDDGASFKVTTSGSASDNYEAIQLFAYGFPAGTQARTFTVSGYVKFPEGETFYAVCRLFVNGYANARDTRVAYTGTGDWQRVWATSTSVAGDTINRVDCIFATQWGTPDVPSRTYWVTRVQAEEKAYATPYADGSLGAGHAWTGTPHASSSTRAAGRVSHSYAIPAESGSVVIRATLSTNTAQPTSYPIIIQAGDYATVDTLAIYTQKSTERLWLDLMEVSTWTGAYPRAYFDFSYPEDVAIYAEWESGQPASISIVGSTGSPISGSSNTAWNPSAASFGTSLSLGASPTGGNQANVLIESAVFFDRPLTDAERDDLLAMPRAWTWGAVGGFIPGGTRIGRIASSWSAVPRIYRADIAGNRLDDLTPPRVESFTASYNDDTATKRAGTFEVLAPNEINDLEDFLVVELDVTRDDGYERTIPLGHYVVMGRSTQMTNSSLRGTLEGRDLTWLLQQATVPASYVVTAGTDPGEAARTILYQQGIPAQLVNVPDAGVVLTRDMPAMPGETWLGFLTDVLAAGAMYQPWAAIDGRITSRRVEDITAVTAVTEYHTADGAKIVPPITNQPDISRLKNRVTVRKVVPGQDPISYTAEVTDRSSPVHPERLAERLGVNTPLVLGVAYDEPNITDEDEAQLLAESRLSEGASFYDRVRIETYPDMALDGHLVMDLDIEHQGGNYYTGRWWQRTWDVSLRGPRPIVTRELTRTVRWR